MYRYRFGRRGRTERADHYRRGRWRRRWPRSRAGRWLLWLLILVVVLIILSQLFGGFQKGTKVGGLGGSGGGLSATRHLSRAPTHMSRAPTENLVEMWLLPSATA
jgi:hypothetical protein